ncbi:MAG: preprotein translocase, SecE subunit, partial [Pseudonocardiales bacterium]|nr:preprotein translocase, SecE subunit [Pseudonocardiales bacterium]
MTATRTEAAMPRPSGGRGGGPMRFVRESISEMRKVLWPSRHELVTYSIVVIIFVVIMVAIVAGL